MRKEATNRYVATPGGLAEVPCVKTSRGDTGGGGTGALRTASSAATGRTPIDGFAAITLS